MVRQARDWVRTCRYRTGTRCTTRTLRDQRGEFTSAGCRLTL